MVKILRVENILYKSLYNHHKILNIKSYHKFKTYQIHANYVWARNPWVSHVSGWTSLAVFICSFHHILLKDASGDVRLYPMTQHQVTIFSSKALLSPLRVIITPLLWVLPWVLFLETHCSHFLPTFPSPAGCSSCFCSQVAFYSQPVHTSVFTHVFRCACHFLSLSSLSTAVL